MSSSIVVGSASEVDTDQNNDRGGLDMSFHIRIAERTDAID